MYSVPHIFSAQEEVHVLRIHSYDRDPRKLAAKTKENIYPLLLQLTPMVFKPNNDTGVSYKDTTEFGPGAYRMHFTIKKTHMELESLYKQAGDFLSGLQNNIGFTRNMMYGRVYRARRLLKDIPKAMV